MHFIFLTLGYHPDKVGGAYRYVAELAERLAARRHRVQAVYPSDTQSSSASESRAGVTLIRYPNARGFFWANWRRENAAAHGLWQRAAQATTEPAVTICCHAYFGRAFQTCRCPRVFLFTGPWAEEHRFARQARPRLWPRRFADRLIIAAMRREEGRALRRAGCIMTLSRYYETQLAQWHGAGLPPVKVISGGVNAELFRPDGERAATRARWGLADNQFLFLAVRRLDPRMGLLTLVDGFGRVAASHPHAGLWIAGAGPQREAVSERISRHGLEGRVKLLGFVPEADLVSLLNAADCVLVPSLDLEGFGLSTVEALACGTPVLGSRAGANPELLLPLGESLLFEAGSAAALAAKLEEVLRDPGALPARQRCRDYVMKHFSWDVVVTAVEETGAGLERAGGRA